MIRQGDILLKKINKIPTNTKKKNNILAYGEATGHKHQLDEKAIVMVDDNGQQYVVAKQQSELMHEEHENIQIPVGNYAVIQQREYDIQEGIKQVLD